MREWHSITERAKQAGCLVKPIKQMKNPSKKLKKKYYRNNLKKIQNPIIYIAIFSIEWKRASLTFYNNLKLCFTNDFYSI